MGLFSFGKNSKSGTSNSTINKNETGTQSGLEGTQSTQQSNTSGTVSSTGSTNTSGTTTQNQSQTGTTSTNVNSTGSSSSFSDGLATGVEGSITNLLSGINEAGSIVGEGVSKLSNFDAAGFVKGIMDQAGSRIQGDLEGNLNGLFDKIGGTGEENSMAALLSQRLQGDAASNLAGIGGQANAQANQILSSNLGAQASALSSVNEFGPALLNALKGGNVQTSQTQAGQETSQTDGTSTGTTNQTEQNNQVQQSQQQTTQSLIQLISQLMNTNMNTTGTESTTSKEKSGGFGFGF